MRIISYKGFDIQELRYHIIYVDNTTGEYTAYQVYLNQTYIYYDLTKAKSMITRYLKR